MKDFAEVRLLGAPGAPPRTAEEAQLPGSFSPASPADTPSPGLG